MGKALAGVSAGISRSRGEGERGEEEEAFCAGRVFRGFLAVGDSGEGEAEDRSVVAFFFLPVTKYPPTAFQSLEWYLKIRGTRKRLWYDSQHPNSDLPPQRGGTKLFHRVLSVPSFYQVQAVTDTFRKFEYQYRKGMVQEAIACVSRRLCWLPDDHRMSKTFRTHAIHVDCVIK